LLSKRSLSAEGQEKIRLSGYKQFLKSALEKHKERFDYSMVLTTFGTQKSPEVKITCLRHQSSFLVRPFNHLRSESGGCEQCDKDQMSNFFLEREREKFLAFFVENLQDRLEIRSEFQGMTNEIELFCKIHRTTSRHKPTYMLNNGGVGCNDCANQSAGLMSRLRESEVIEKLSPTLPDHIRILNVTFDPSKHQSVISAICDAHGEFQTTTGYLRKSEHKCPKCGREHVGYTGHRLQELVARQERGRPTYLGVMEIEVFGISAMKVGVTVRSLEERYKWHLKTVFLSVQLDEVDAYILENQIRRNFRRFQDLRIMKAGMRHGERWSGDTEVYRFAIKNEIISFIDDFIRSGSRSLNYEDEVNLYQIPDFVQRNTSREKSKKNKPISVVGVDPVTNEVVQRFPSTSDAARAGFKSVSMVLSENYDRDLSGGLRWFREEDYDPDDIRPLPTSVRGNPKRVICVETGEVFDSISIAERQLQERGIRTSGSHITSVCKGRRKTAGGYHWRYSE
jgi:hypothetical protein